MILHIPSLLVGHTRLIELMFRLVRLTRKEYSALKHVVGQVKAVVVLGLEVVVGQLESILMGSLQSMQFPKHPLLKTFNISIEFQAKSIFD